MGIVDKYKKHQKAMELKQWNQLLSKGKCVRSCDDDRFGNCWLFNPNLLKASRFLTALRIRGGTTGDRVTLNKAIPQATVKYRKCKDCRYPSTHPASLHIHIQSRIKRHDKIRDLLAKTLASSGAGTQVIEEASVVIPSSALKPYVVVLHQGRVQGIDVNIRHENTRNFEDGQTSKMEKYTPLLPLLAEKIH
jgi:hypothetical protein